MNPIPFVKPISLLGILQFIICIGGFMTAATMLKTGWIDVPVPDHAVFWRNQWLLLLLIPVTWTIFASWDIEYDVLQFPMGFHFISGIAICVFLIFLWSGIVAKSTRFHRLYGAVQDFEPTLICFG